jgi:hypothetical protein
MGEKMVAPAAKAVVHSEIGASSMHRWAACPGSVRLSRGIPRVSSRYADEGTGAHDLASTIIECELAGQEWFSDGADPEMLEHVRVYVDAVKALARGGNKALIEHSFDLSEVHPGLFGTCDAVVFDKKAGRLHVVDFKYGAGIPVEVKDNEQLKYYGLGALYSTSFGCTEIELTIVQPRCAHPDGPIRSHRFDAFEIMEFAADLKEAALRTEDPFAPLVAGEHCRFCPAAGVCPEVKNKAVTLAKAEFSKVPTVGEAYDAKELSKTLEWLPVLETWIESVRQFAYAEAMAGRPLPGWKLVEKMARRKWRNEEEVVKHLEAKFTPVVLRSCFEQPALKSPTQLEKIIHQKHWSEIEAFVVKNSSGLTLVPESDKRPAVKTLDAKEEFESLDLLS